MTLSDTLSRTEATDPLLLTDEAARALLADAPWRRFAAVGDSLALGVGDPSPGYRALGWSDRLAELLTAVHPDTVYRNTGRIGATVEQIIAEQLDAVREFAPDLVHVSAGGNDLFLPGGPKDLARHLDTLFGAVAETGAQIVAFTIANVWDSERMAPMRGLREPMDALNRTVRATAARHGALLVEFWDHPVRLRPDAMSADLIHFATSAQAVVTTEVVRALNGIVPRAAVQGR